MPARPAEVPHPLLRRLLPCFLVLVGGLCLALASSGQSGESAEAPETAGLAVGSSALVELAAFVNGLRHEDQLVRDTPPKAEAYTNAIKLSRSDALVLCRQLEPYGLTSDALYRYILLHTPPPALVPRQRILPEFLPEAESLLLRDRKVELKRLTEGLRSLYRFARLEAILERHERTRESTVQALRSAWPADEPLSILSELTGESPGQGQIMLVPSLLAGMPARFRFPVDQKAPPPRISVVPIGEDGVPSPSDAALIRYEEVARWILEPMFFSYRRELSELARGGASLTDQIIRALYLMDQRTGRPELLPSAEARSQGDAFSQLKTLETGLEAWGGARASSRTLRQFFPELLDRVALALEGIPPLPKLEDGGFERWAGEVPELWRVEITEPARGVARPSQVIKTRGERKGSSALMLSGDEQTNEWQGVYSVPVPVQANDHVVVTGRMRSRNLEARGRTVITSHLEARVKARDGAVLRRVTSRDFTGTAPWETVSLELVVPAGADFLEIGCVLGMPGEVYFDDVTLNLQRPSMMRFLRNGGFEELQGNAPADWEVVTYTRQTQSGPSVASVWQLDPESPVEGRKALKLFGDALTGQWLELRSHLMSVIPGQRVTVTGQMRSLGITLDPRQHRHANMTLIFLNERGLIVHTAESPVLEGSNGWKEVSIEAVAPIEAVSMRVGCLLTMSGELWFDDLHISRR